MTTAVAAGSTPDEIRGARVLGRIRSINWSRLLVPAQLVASGVAAVTVAAVVAAPVWLTLALLAAITVAVPASDRESMRPGWMDLDRLVSAASLSLATVTVTVALTDLGEKVLWHATAIVATSTVTLGVAQLVIRLAPRPLRLVLVGTARGAATALDSWDGRADLVVAGVLVIGSEHADVDRGWTVPVSDDVASARELVNLWRADAVVVLPGDGVGAVTVQWLDWALEGSDVRLAVGSAVDGVARHRLHLARACGSTFTRIEPSRPSALVSRVKGAQDRVVGVALLLLFAPMLAVLALLIRLDSPGPAVFRQTRVGLRGRPFTMLKLRTMAVDAEQVLETVAESDEGNGVLFKIRRDPRITRVGRVLRTLSLDELPQLVNVVRGEMSLVGPRPALPSEVAAYDERARRRLAVKPGLTGLWQVRGRSDLSWDESVALDLHYTDNISLARDLAICVETIRAVASRKGAY